MVLLAALPWMAGRPVAAQPADPLPTPAVAGEPQDQDTNQDSDPETAPAPPATADSPAVASLLASEPAEPAELLRSIVLLVQLGQYEVAKTRIEKLAAAGLGDQQMAELVRQVGSDRLLIVSQSPGVAPEGRKLADVIWDGANRWIRDPARLAEWTAQLADPDISVRDAALTDLTEAGETAAVFLVSALADPARQAMHDAIGRALAQMGSLSLEPLLAAIDSDDPEFLTRVMDVCGQLTDRKTSVYPHLLGPAFTSPDRQTAAAGQRALLRLAGRPVSLEDAERVLLERVRGHLQTAADPPRGTDPLRFKPQRSWRWDGSARTCVEMASDPRADAARKAARLAAALAAIAPDEDRYRELALLSRLEAEGWETVLSHAGGEAAGGEATDKSGVDDQEETPAGSVAATQPLPQASLDEVQSALRLALDRRLTRAATRAVEVLGAIGSAELLRGGDSGRAPVVQALTFGDPRLARAAVGTILAWETLDRFTGSSGLVGAMESILSTRGTRLAVVGDPRQHAARDLAGLLVDEGFKALDAVTGRGVVELAARSADVEWIFVDMSIDGPAAREVVYRLRRDPRSARIPLVLLAGAGRLDEAQRLADDYPWTLATPRPHTAESLRDVLALARPWHTQHVVPLAERLAGAGQLLEQLAASDGKAWDTPRALEEQILAAAGVPRLSEPALRVLVTFATPASQQALVDLASRAAAELALRQRAAEGFRASVERHGLLLGRRQVMLQYDRYNASEADPEPIQRLLGSILDTIEGAVAEVSGQVPGASAERRGDGRPARRP